MRKLLPILLAALGLGAGVAAGVLLKPAPAPATARPEGAEADHGATDDRPLEIVTLDNQFVVPVLHQAEVAALVVLSIGLEVEAGTAEAVYKLEPRLRDAFLRVLFDHANAGGFQGSFTSTGTMTLLRVALDETAEKTLGDVFSGVLITDIVRQDM